MMRIFLFFPITLILIFCDQWTKSVINEHLQLGESVVIIPKFLNLTNVHNYGFAFGILRDANEVVKISLVILISVFLIFILYWAFFRETNPLKRVSLVLIFSGGVGNFVDRLVYGYVRDFIDFYYGQYHWPAFNFADVYVCIGAAIFIFFDIKKPGP